jgi:hypothetical protein
MVTVIREQQCRSVWCSWGPDTFNKGWDWRSGYNYSDSSIMGFSHTHLSGTGIGDMLDFLIMPGTGPVKTIPGTRENPDEGYRSRFSHEDEKAAPGYYSVTLLDYRIHAELTATERAGLHRYTFPADQTSHFILDLDHGYADGPGVGNQSHGGFALNSTYVDRGMFWFPAGSMSSALSLNPRGCMPSLGWRCPRWSMRHSALRTISDRRLRALYKSGWRLKAPRRNAHHGSATSEPREGAPTGPYCRSGGNALRSTSGDTRVDQLAVSSGFSPRQFRRLFMERVGTPPKIYARVLRLNAAIAAKAANPGMSWTEI